MVETVVRNSTYERWEAASRPPPGERPSEGEELAPGIPRYAVNMPLSGIDGNVEAMVMYAGQGVGSIDAVEPAAAIVERFAAAPAAQLTAAKCSRTAPVGRTRAGRHPAAPLPGSRKASLGRRSAGGRCKEQRRRLPPGVRAEYRTAALR